jgi:hypothetical protein
MLSTAVRPAAPVHMALHRAIKQERGFVYLPAAESSWAGLEDRVTVRCLFSGLAALLESRHHAFTSANAGVCTCMYSIITQCTARSAEGTAHKQQLPAAVPGVLCCQVHVVWLLTHTCTNRIAFAPGSSRLPVPWWLHLALHLN